jgi:hypothetical protein
LGHDYHDADSNNEIVVAYYHNNKAPPNATSQPENYHSYPLFRHFGERNTDNKSSKS